MSQSHWEAQSDEQRNGMDRGRGGDRGAEAMSMNYMSGTVPHQQGKRGEWEQKETSGLAFHCDLSSVLGSKEEGEQEGGSQAGGRARRKESKKEGEQGGGKARRKEGKEEGVCQRTNHSQAQLS